MKVQGDGYTVSRNAPRELVQALPQLWNSLSRQRFAWLQLPWALFFLLVLLMSSWPAAVVFLSLWLWQRKSPSLPVCRLIELLVHVYFLLLIIAVMSLFSLLPGGAFFLIGVAGVIMLCYERSARSWHYLFNYMALCSQEFTDSAISMGWIKQKNTAVAGRTTRPVIVAISGLVLSIAIITCLEIINRG